MRSQSPARSHRRLSEDCFAQQIPFIAFQSHFIVSNADEKVNPDLFIRGFRTDGEGKEMEHILGKDEVMPFFFRRGMGKRTRFLGSCERIFRNL